MAAGSFGAGVTVTLPVARSALTSAPGCAPCTALVTCFTQLPQVISFTSKTVLILFSSGGGMGVGRAAAAETFGGSNRRSRSALVNTKTLDSAMAPAPSIGDSSVPLTGYSAPAATGINTTL